jgi:hypothetical protein
MAGSITGINFMPRALQMLAKAIPKFPDVDSTTQESLVISPSFSAFSKIKSAGLSLMLPWPQGLNCPGPFFSGPHNPKFDLHS